MKINYTFFKSILSLTPLKMESNIHLKVFIQLPFILC